MAKKQDLSKVEIPTGQFKHSMADPQFGRLKQETKGLAPHGKDI